jgi:hypothetical protein
VSVFATANGGSIRSHGRTRRGKIDREEYLANYFF